MDQVNKQLLQINKQMVQELKMTNRSLANVLIFLLARESYTDAQIRAIFGTLDNNRVRQLSSGLKKSRKTRTDETLLEILKELKKLNK